jgi:hypothetical protein
MTDTHAFPVEPKPLEQWRGDDFFTWFTDYATAHKGDVPSIVLLRIGQICGYAGRLENRVDDTNERITAARRSLQELVQLIDEGAPRD